MENINLENLEQHVKDKKLIYIKDSSKKIVWCEHKNKKNKELASKGSDYLVIAEYQRKVTLYSNVHFPDSYINVIRERDKDKKPSKRTVNVFKVELINCGKFFNIKDRINPLF